jgi:hypothetical protein
MGLLDRAKAAAEQAAAKAKEGIEEAQTKRELGQTYGELGKATFELMESGKLAEPSLEELAAKIRALNEKLESGDGGGTTTGESVAANEPGSDQPPAMPV